MAQGLRDGRSPPETTLAAKENPAAFRLYTRLGHARLEDVVWYDTEFYSFEKLL